MDFQKDKARESERQERVAIINQILQVSGIQGDSNKAFDLLTDRVRTLVNESTAHNMDALFYATWKYPKKMAQSLLDYITQKTSEPPHFECSTRADIMADMMQAMGYETRTVVVYAPDENLASHTFLEVYDPGRARWIIHDPAYDVYWIHTTTKERVGFESVVAAPDSHRPCTGNVCAWDRYTREKFDIPRLKKFTTLATFIDKKRNKRYSIHGPSHDPAQSYTVNGETGVFCALIKKQCRDGLRPAHLP